MSRWGDYVGHRRGQPDFPLRPVAGMTSWEGREVDQVGRITFRDGDLEIHIWEGRVTGHLEMHHAPREVCHLPFGQDSGEMPETQMTSQGGHCSLRGRRTSALCRTYPKEGPKSHTELVPNSWNFPNSLCTTSNQEECSKAPREGTSSSSPCVGKRHPPATLPIHPRGAGFAPPSPGSHRGHADQEGRDRGAVRSRM